VLRNHGKKGEETFETRFLRMGFGVTVTHTKGEEKINENV